MSHVKPMQFVPVRVRRVLLPDGPSCSTSVACPERASPVAPETCQQCEHVAAIAFGPSAFVACRPPTSPVPDTARASRQGLDARTPISALMTTDVACVPRQLGIEALMAVFLDRHIGAVPVVDEDGRPVGVVTKTDVVRHYYENLDGDAVEERCGDEPGLHVLPFDDTRVEDVMTPLPQTLREDDALGAAAALMTFQHIHHVPIAGSDGRVVGMLSALDFARGLSAEYLPAPPPRAKRILLIDSHDASRAALAELLEDEGYDVLALHSGRAAVRALAGFPADLVLADLDLPSSGADALREAAGRTFHSPIVWMAVRRQKPDVTCLIKPIAMPELLRTIERALAPAPSPQRRND